MTPLVEFLLARIAEDESSCGPEDAQGLSFCDAEEGTHYPAARVLAECEAKRRIVEDYEALNADYRATHDPTAEARRFQALVSIGQLATAYADHPDYDETWRP